jgi:hypothetical protein
MDHADIPAWVTETRATAKTQMERWQGVDPSRLLEACDLIEQLLQPNQLAPCVVQELHVDGPALASEIAERVVRWPCAAGDQHRRFARYDSWQDEQDALTVREAERVLRIHPDSALGNHARDVIEQIRARQAQSSRISPATSVAVAVTHIQRLTRASHGYLSGGAPDHENVITVEGLLDRRWAAENDQMLTLERICPHILLIPR